ncbi:hypothetical protein BKA69DRAFT_1039466 [Paraphysoderma sedebokerense]|nr:hypothetical protein BKA69DRAFT_1039466 [Paraphysoderma sedebokerense]
MPPRYFIGIATQDHVRLGVSTNTAQLGHGRPNELSKLSINDYLIYYSPRQSLNPKSQKIQSFTAVGKVMSEMYQVNVEPSESSRSSRRSESVEMGGSNSVPDAIQKTNKTPAKVGKFKKMDCKLHPWRRNIKYYETKGNKSIQPILSELKVVTGNGGKFGSVHGNRGQKGNDGNAGKEGKEGGDGGDGKNWKRNWGLVFRRSLVEIGKDDFDTIVKGWAELVE